MLASCLRITSKTKQRARYIHLYNHIPTSQRAAFYELNGGSSPSNDNSIQILAPVPRIRNALFENTSLVKPWWYDTLNTKADARDPKLHRWKKLRLVGSTSVISLTRLVSRMRKLGLNPSAETALYGIRLASFDSCNPVAMKEYLQIWLIAPNRASLDLQSVLRATISQVSWTVAKWCKSHLVRENRRLALRYLEVITGWRRGHKQNLDEIRQPSLYHLFLTQGPGSWKYYVQYMYILRILQAPNALYHAWIDFSDRMKVNKTPAKASKSAAKGDASSPESVMSTQNVNLARNVTIRMLVSLGAWQLAWKTAYEAEHISRNIEPRSWACLLRYPQGARKWIQNMNDPAMEMLELEICDLEKKLGVRWKGGEEGHHVVERGPFLQAHKDDYSLKDFI